MTAPTLDPVFDQLARAFVAVSRLFDTPGEVSGERRGLHYSAIGGPVAGFNRLMATRMVGETVEADLDAAMDELHRFPLLSAWIPPGAEPLDLADRFERRGFVRDDDLVPAMSAPLADLPTMTLPGGVTWTLVRDAAAMAVAIDVVCRGFEIPDAARPFFEHALALPAGHPAELATFLVAVDGVPASTALAGVDGDVVAIYNVATVPEARGRGLAAVATGLAMRYGAEHGAASAVLESSEMGVGLYRRLGFREVGRFRVLVRRREGAVTL